jgi:pimeloyl-ACP methyl ester carboxylesterase
MPISGRLALVAVVLLVLAMHPALSAAPAGDGGPISRGGTYAGGRYVIEVPAGWNGGLVIYAHGFEGSEHSPLASHLAANGYAWAASSFRSGGYRPDWFLEDTLQVRDLFIREVGRPRWTIIHGQSMGGHVAIASLELRPGVYQGALLECGVIDGVGLGDLYLAYKAAAEYFGGAPLLDAMDRPELPAQISALWLPALGEPGRYTAQGRRFDSVIKHLFGGDLPLRLQGLRQRYVPNMLVPMLGPLGRAGSTLHVRYRIDPGLGVDEAELNRKIRRFAPVAGARSRELDPVFAELTGRITVPVLAIHETGDARVPFSLQQAYRRRTLAAGTSHLLVQRAIRWGGHCAFDGEARERAFDDLVAWIERGVKPDGDDVLAADVSKLGLRWTPLLHPDDPAQPPPARPR